MTLAERPEGIDEMDTTQPMSEDETQKRVAHLKAAMQSAEDYEKVITERDTLRARVGELEAELAKERAAPIEVSEQLSRMVLVTDEECARLERVNRELEARLAVPLDTEIENCVYELSKISPYTAPEDIGHRARRAAEMLERLARRVQELEKDAPVGLNFTLREARALVEFFGGEDTQVTVRDMPKGAVTDEDEPGTQSPAGLWAHCTEYPEEGHSYLGPGDDVQDDFDAAIKASE